MKEKVKKFIEKMGWRYVENGAMLRLDVDGDTMSWTSFMKVDEENSISYFALFPTKAEAQRVEFIAKLADAINCEIWMGNFEIVLNGEYKGQIRMRTSAFVPTSADEETMNQIFESIVAFNMAAMNRYAPVLMKAIFGNSDRIEDYIEGDW